MAIYDKKDGVNTGKTSFTRVCTCKHWKMKKCRFLHLNYGIRVPYFWSGCFKNIRIVYKVQNITTLPCHKYKMKQFHEKQWWENMNTKLGIGELRRKVLSLWLWVDTSSYFRKLVVSAICETFFHPHS